MARSPLRIIVPLSLGVWLAGCATPEAPGIAAGPIQPATGETVVVDHVIVVVDASGSINGESLFPPQKALAESFAKAMPAGSYTSGAIGFGGEQRDVLPQAAFDRERTVRGIREIRHLQQGTPLDAVLAELRDTLRERVGRAAIVIFSDGLVTSAKQGDPRPDAYVLAIGQALIDSRRDPTCIHTVQTGDDAKGGALLRKLSALSPCGSYRAQSSLFDVASLHGLERDVFIGALPPVASPPPVKRRIVLRGVQFDFDRAEVKVDGTAVLDEAARLLQENPSISVTVDGYTDDRGGEDYNMELSNRRAVAVRNYLVSKGVDASRLRTKHHGESQPVASNDTREGRAQNRRVELNALP